jgi:hypothetical protein
MCRAGGRRCPGGHSHSKANQAARQRLSRANRALTAAHAAGDPTKIEAAQQKLTKAQSEMDQLKKSATPETPEQTRDVTAMPAPEPSPKSDPKPPVSGRMSNNPILDNGWGDPSQQDINFHEDGAIGTALSNMGPDRRMDVDGEPLANVMGRVATDVVTGRRTAQEGLDEYKAIRERLPADSVARAELTYAIARMDAPETAAPQVPHGTPQPLRQLITDLHAVPIVRQDPSREMDDLVGIAQDAADGKIRGARLADAVRDVANRRHESDGDAGKFEIDRAVSKAVTELRKPPPLAPETPTPQRDVPPPKASTSDKPGAGPADNDTNAGDVTPQAHAGQDTTGQHARQAAARAAEQAQRETGQATQRRNVVNVASGGELVAIQVGHQYGDVYVNGVRVDPPGRPSAD